MTDQLSELLHRGTDDLPVYVRSVSGLKQDVERAGQRRRRTAAVAAAAAVTLIVGAGAVLARPDGTKVPPTPAVTDTPPDVPTDRGLLRPPQLPTDATFPGWTGTRPATATDIPLCLDALGTPLEASYQQITTDQPDTDAYQAVLNLGTPEAAAKAADDTHQLPPAGEVPVANKLLACASLESNSWDSAGGSHATANMPWVGPSHRVRLLVRAHAGPYLSLLWLSAPGTQKLSYDQVIPFNDLLSSALYEAMAGPLRDVPPGTLAQAMLRADDIPTGPRPVHDGQARANYFSPLPSACDTDVRTGNPAIRNAVFSDEAITVLAGQRVYVAMTAEAAHQLFGDLAAAVRRCAAADSSEQVDTWTELDLNGVGDEAAGWSYRLGLIAGPRKGQVDHVYVTIARVGSVVTQVVSRGPYGDGDPGPQAVVDLARLAVHRLTDRLPGIASASK
jgi:hypothetical protein